MIYYFYVSTIVNLSEGVQAESQTSPMPSSYSPAGIAVGGGGAGWAVAPPFGSKRRKFGQIVYLFGQLFCLFST